MKLKILIVDDEECIRDSFRWHLEDQGHEVLTASEPLLCDVYCAEDCRKQEPCADLLLIDYHMPRMNGLEFLEQLVERGCKSPPANRILMSGSPMDIDRDRARKVGCRVVAKPLSIAELDDIVRSASEHVET